ncbi:MAG: NADH-quinone oxidoreductase subunit A [Myxococcales bacterium]|nr:NADH-quinone oxidoreductase subunit A [Myxococcales bacterium]
MERYLPILLLFFVAAVVAGVIYAVAIFVGRIPKGGPVNLDKERPFECGNPSDGASTLRPTVKFYLTALVFVVFDIEAVMIYPWAVKFSALGWNGVATMGSFIALLVVALVYVWRKGALEWEK